MMKKVTFGSVFIVCDYKVVEEPIERYHVMENNRISIHDYEECNSDYDYDYDVCDYDVCDDDYEDVRYWQMC
jgi:hypothetical protein